MFLMKQFLRKVLYLYFVFFFKNDRVTTQMFRSFTDFLLSLKLMAYHVLTHEILEWKKYFSHNIGKSSSTFLLHVHWNRSFLLSDILLIFLHYSIFWYYILLLYYGKIKKRLVENKNKLRKIYPKNYENFKNSKPRVQYYWFL